MKNLLVIISAVMMFPAFPATRYVAVDGTGDGTTSENPMASFASAYRQAAADATADAPGVVYVARGMYRLQETVTLLPNVKVIGQEGGQTVLSGDNQKTSARAAYWSCNFVDSSYVLKPGIAKTPVWNDDLTYNEPNPENLPNWYCSWYGNTPCNTDRGFENSAADIGENAFEHVTFTLFRYGAFKFSRGRLVLKNCTFVGDGCNVLTPGTASVAASGEASVEVKGCEFVGCAGCLLLSGNGDSFVEETIFRENSVRDCVNVSGTHRLALRGCIFSRNWTTASSGAVVSCASSNLGNLVEDCRFEENVAVNSSNGAVCLSGATNRIRRCNFVSNRNMDWAYDYSPKPDVKNEKCLMAARTACLYTDSIYSEISNCSFTGNELSVSARQDADVALIGHNVAAQKHTVFYNCNFGENRIAASGQKYAALFHRVNGELSFAHSVISSNSYSGEKAVPFYSSYNGSNHPLTGFYNTIFDEAGFDRNPFFFLKPSQGAPVLITSVVKGFDSSSFAYDDADRYTTSVFTPSGLSGKIVSTADGRRFARLSSASKFRKMGCPVHRDADGVIWVYQSGDKNYLRLDKGTVKDVPAGFELGVTPLSCDALGALRPYGEISPGAVNALKSGIAVFVR